MKKYLKRGLLEKSIYKKTNSQNKASNSVMNDIINELKFFTTNSKKSKNSFCQKKRNNVFLIRKKNVKKFSFLKSIRNKQFKRKIDAFKKKKVKRILYTSNVNLDDDFFKRLSSVKIIKAYKNSNILNRSIAGKNLLFFMEKIKREHLTRFNFYKGFFKKKFKFVKGRKFAFVPYNIYVNKFQTLNKSRFFYKFYDIQSAFISRLKPCYDIYRKFGSRRKFWRLGLILIRFFYSFFFQKSDNRYKKNYLYHFINASRWRKKSRITLQLKKSFLERCYRRSRFCFKFRYKLKECLPNVFNFKKNISFFFLKNNFLKIFYLLNYFFKREYSRLRLSKYKRSKLKKKASSNILVILKNKGRFSISYIIFKFLKNYSLRYISVFSNRRRKLRGFLKWNSAFFGGSFIYEFLLRGFVYSKLSVISNNFKSFKCFNFLFRYSFSHNNRLKRFISALNFEFISETFIYNLFIFFIKRFLRYGLLFFKSCRFIFKKFFFFKIDRKAKKRYNAIKDLIFLFYRFQLPIKFLYKTFKLYHFKTESEFDLRYFSMTVMEKVKKLLYIETIPIKELLALPQRNHNFIKRRNIFDLLILDLNLSLKSEREVLVENLLLNGEFVLYVSKVIGGFYHKALAQHFMIFDYGYKNYAYLPLLSSFFSSVDFLGYNFIYDIDRRRIKFYNFFVDFLKYNFQRVYKCEFVKYKKKFDNWNDFFFSENWNPGSRSGQLMNKSFSSNFIEYNYGLLEGSDSIIKKNRLYLRLFSSVFRSSFGQLTFLKFSNKKDVYKGDTFSVVHIFKYFVKRNSIRCIASVLSQKLKISSYSLKFCSLFSYNLKILGYILKKVTLKIMYNIDFLVGFIFYYFFFFRLYNKVIKNFLLFKVFKVIL